MAKESPIQKLAPVDAAVNVFVEETEQLGSKSLAFFLSIKLPPLSFSNSAWTLYLKWLVRSILLWVHVFTLPINWLKYTGTFVSKVTCLPLKGCRKEIDLAWSANRV